MYQEMHMWDEAIEVAEAKVNFSQLFTTWYTTINSHCISKNFSKNLILLLTVYTRFGNSRLLLAQIHKIAIEMHIFLG